MLLLRIIFPDIIVPEPAWSVGSLPQGADSVQEQVKNSDDADEPDHDYPYASS